MILSAYMGYDKIAGSEEGACLIFARSSREAKRIGYPIVCGWFGSDYIDFRVQRLKEPYLFKLKERDGPHVIESPPICDHCELWGGEPIETDECNFCTLCECDIDQNDDAKCPGCDVEITVQNVGGYRTYCCTCVESIPPLPGSGGYLLTGKYPDFKWELQST